MGSLANLFGGIIAAVCFIAFIISAATSWYTQEQNGVGNSTCALTASYLAGGVHLYCSDQCPRGGPRSISYCDVVRPYSSDDNMNCQNSVNIVCLTMHQAEIIRAAVAMAALACIFAFFAAVIMLLAFFISSPGPILNIFTRFKLGFVFALLTFICGLLALIIMGAGFEQAYRDDTACLPNCPDLFYSRRTNNDGSSSSAGFGFAYWWTLAFTILVIAAVVLAWIGARGGGGGGGGHGDHGRGGEHDEDHSKKPHDSDDHKEGD